MEAAEILQALFTSVGDPYTHYADLLAVGEVCHPSPESPTFFAVSYAAIESVLRDPLLEAQGNARLAEGFPALIELDETSMVHLNGDEHARIRRLTTKAFSRRRVASLEAAIATTTASLLDDMAARGAAGEPVDFVQHFAYLLPVTLICILIGIPQADREMFRPLAADLGIGHLGEQPPKDALAVADAAAVQLNNYK